MSKIVKLVKRLMIKTEIVKFKNYTKKSLFLIQKIPVQKINESKTQVSININIKLLAVLVIN